MALVSGQDIYQLNDDVIEKLTDYADADDMAAGWARSLIMANRDQYFDTHYRLSELRTKEREGDILVDDSRIELPALRPNPADN